MTQEAISEISRNFESINPKPMDQQTRDQWTSALRSGDYKQGRTYLTRNDKNCCLGVLCSIKQIPYTIDASIDTVSRIYDFGDIKSKRYLGDGFRQSVGLTQESENLLTIANDHMNLTFDQIADLVDKYL